MSFKIMKQRFTLGHDGVESMKVFVEILTDKKGKPYPSEKNSKTYSDPKKVIQFMGVLKHKKLYKNRFCFIQNDLTIIF